MSISARLNPKMMAALARYCKTHGLTKTQAIERGIGLLLGQHSEPSHHPAFAAFERLQERLTTGSAEGRELESTRTLKQHLDAKYPA